MPRKFLEGLFYNIKPLETSKHVPMLNQNDSTLATQLKQIGLDTFLTRQVKEESTEEELRRLLVDLGAEPMNEELVLPRDRLIGKIEAQAITQLKNRQPNSTLSTLDDAVELIRKAQNILVVTGAGTSVSAGIPDFRSAEGLYAKLHEEASSSKINDSSTTSIVSSDLKRGPSTNLPETPPSKRPRRQVAIKASERIAKSNQEEVFDLNDPREIMDYNIFKIRPEIFYSFAHLIYPDPGRRPTPTHRFIKSLEEKGKLLRNYSQNIDGLEASAGIEKYFLCHGSFNTASCTVCEKVFRGQTVEKAIRERQVPPCPGCKRSKGKVRAVLKPDITFFHQRLSSEYDALFKSDREVVDLLIIIGTSLPVDPVKNLPFSIPHEVPQVLINLEMPKGLRPDIWLEGQCDDITTRISEKLGWT